MQEAFKFFKAKIYYSSNNFFKENSVLWNRLFAGMAIERGRGELAHCFWMLAQFSFFKFFIFSKKYLYNKQTKI